MTSCHILSVMERLGKFIQQSLRIKMYVVQTFSVFLYEQYYIAFFYSYPYRIFSKFCLGRGSATIFSFVLCSSGRYLLRYLSPRVFPRCFDHCFNPKCLCSSLLRQRRHHSYVHTFILRQLFYPRDLYGELRTQMEKFRSIQSSSITDLLIISYLRTPPLGQDMTQGQFLSWV